MIGERKRKKKRRRKWIGFLRCSYILKLVAGYWFLAYFLRELNLQPTWQQQATSNKVNSKCADLFVTFSKRQQRERELTRQGVVNLSD